MSDALRSIADDHTGSSNNGVDVETLMLHLRERVRQRRERGKATENDSPDARPVQEPLVSVIVLNLNGEAIIAKCLEHLLAQTYPHLEILVVDNGSKDRSLEILKVYEGRKDVSVVRSKRNLGVAGGRNLGLRCARGDIIAFMDNDGYPDRDWLKEAVGTLMSKENIGAVASLVFLSKRKLLLNGAGGTMNLQGYGGDLCFNTPYEFATIPHEVLYPMGCGMLVRRNVLERIGPLDPVPMKWFDDTELGIRIWKLGFRVVVSERAFVDHDWNTSDQFLAEGMARRIYLFDRARIRNALKYYPAAKLPKWLYHEVRWNLELFNRAGRRHIPLRVWAWNMLHLPSALRWRLKFFFRKYGFWHLLDRSWGFFPPPAPNNHAFRPDLREIDSRLILDGCSDQQSLNFGWYSSERDDSTSFRRTEAYASAFFRFSSHVHSMTIRFRTDSNNRPIRVIMRRAGQVDPRVEVHLAIRSSGWREESFPVCIDPGIYELLLVTGETRRDPLPPSRGPAISFITFC